MNSLSIFAGIDAQGALRFVGDVPRGADCGCRCAACNAPLVARRGALRAWHFAHEASQERPDCLAGAVNLLRRLAIQRLRDAGVPALPPYIAQVRTRFPLPQLVETITWQAGEATAEGWETNPPQTAPVAWLRHREGTDLRLFVSVGSQAVPNVAALPAEVGAVLYEVPLPDGDDGLHDLVAAVRHIDNRGSLRWLRCPDAEVAKTRALAELEVHAKAKASAGIAPDLLTKDREAAPRFSDVDESPWAAWRKPRNAFVFYGLKDGSAWVIFPHKDGRYFMAPYPAPFDGWDEAIPSSIGSLTPELSAYLVCSLQTAMVFMGRLAAMVQTPSTWAELQALPWPPATRRGSS